MIELRLLVHSGVISLKRFAEAPSGDWPRLPTK